MQNFKFKVGGGLEYSAFVSETDVIVVWPVAGTVVHMEYTLDEVIDKVERGVWKITEGVFDYKKSMPELADEFYFKHSKGMRGHVYKCKKFTDNRYEVSYFETPNGNVGVLLKGQIQKYLANGVWVICDKPEEKLDVSILKPFMRVVTREHGVFMVANNIHAEGLIAIAKDGWISLPVGEDSDHEWAVMAVYNVPLYNSDILTLTKLGKQLWAHSEFNESMIEEYKDV